MGHEVLYEGGKRGKEGGEEGGGRKGEEERKKGEEGEKREGNLNIVVSRRCQISLICTLLVRLNLAMA